MRRDIGRRLLAAAVLASVATLAACSSSPSTTPKAAGSSTKATSTPAASATGIRTRSTSIGTVLTDAQGMTLYWFAPDTPKASKCNGSCATYWPPVKGPVSAAAGVSLPGTFGTITRQDGSVQATYDGHPLYTYSGDTSPGQTNGNAVNASGGLWYAVTPSGAKPDPHPSASTSSKGSGGGW